MQFTVYLAVTQICFPSDIAEYRKISKRQAILFKSGSYSLTITKIKKGQPIAELTL